jgi:hypothetical protein
MAMKTWGYNSSVMLGQQPGVTRALDRFARLAWRSIGRPIDISSEHRWLDGPSNPAGGFGDEWLRAYEIAGRVQPRRPTDGLLEDMAVLDGDEFDSALVDPTVRHFYEHTASWGIQAWSQWNPAFAWCGELVARLWSRRIQQLAIPVQPMAVSFGMSSVVQTITDDTDRRVGAAWVRELNSDGSKVYSGFYRAGHVPKSSQPRVHITFPLESGSAQVFLTPCNDPDGSFWLRSGADGFGGDGFYTVLRVGEQWYAAKAPFRETFHVYRDEQGLLRTDHWVNLGRWQLFWLHYKLERAVGGRDELAN